MPSNVLYVDNAGNDLTAIRGNEDWPYRTIQGALGAASDDDVIALAPQPFVLTSPVTVPNTLSRIGFKGWGSSPVSSLPTGQWTLVTGPAGAPAFDLSTNSHLARVFFMDMQIAQGAGGTAIKADGTLANTALSNSFMSLGLVFQNCGISSSTFKYVSFGPIFKDCRSAASSLSLVSCGAAQLFDSSYFPNVAVTVDYDGTDPLRATSTPLCLVTAGSRIGGSGAVARFTVSGQGRLQVDENAVIGGLRGLNLTAIPGGLTPSIVVNGGILASGTYVDFANPGSELPDTANAMTVDLRGASFDGCLGAIFKVGGAAANARAVQLDGCDATVSGFHVSAGENVQITNRGSSGTFVYSTPGAVGTALPASPYRMAPVAAVAPQTTFFFGFRVAAATYDVQAVSDTLATPLVGVVSGRTATTFNVEVPVVGAPAIIDANVVFA